MLDGIFMFPKTALLIGLGVPLYVVCMYYVFRSGKKHRLHLQTEFKKILQGCGGETRPNVDQRAVLVISETEAPDISSSLRLYRNAARLDSIFGEICVALYVSGPGPNTVLQTAVIYGSSICSPSPFIASKFKLSQIRFSHRSSTMDGCFVVSTPRGSDALRSCPPDIAKLVASIGENQFVAVGSDGFVIRGPSVPDGGNFLDATRHFVGRITPRHQDCQPVKRD